MGVGSPELSPRCEVALAAPTSGSQITRLEQPRRRPHPPKRHHAPRQRHCQGERSSRMSAMIAHRATKKQAKPAAFHHPRDGRAANRAPKPASAPRTRTRLASHPGRPRARSLAIRMLTMINSHSPKLTAVPAAVIQRSLQSGRSAGKSRVSSDRRPLAADRKWPWRLGTASRPMRRCVQGCLRDSSSPWPVRRTVQTRRSTRVGHQLRQKLRPARRVRPARPRRSRRVVGAAPVF
jgi:hypothetical protein